MSALDPSLLAELRGFSSPSIANAIETFGIRPRNTGYMDATIRCMFPELGGVCGFAATATIRADEPGTSRDRALWAHVASQSAPCIVVVHDLDEPRGIGSLWGEVNANIHQAFGAVGVVTDGCVRDLDEMQDLGFHAFAASVGVSHAYVHVEDVGMPVRVGGLEVSPGDLLLGDRHGVISIPLEIAAQIPDAVRTLETDEKDIIAMFRDPDFDASRFIGDVTH